MTPPPIIVAARAGFSVPGAESFYGRPIVKMSLLGLDVSINRTVIIMFAATAIVAILFLAGFSRPRLVPRGFQNVMEYGVDFVRNNIVLPVMGPSGLSYLPYLSVLFFFIFFCNIFEVVPFLNFPATSRLALPMVLALLTWLLFVVAGIRSQGLGHYIKGSLVPPGVPKALLIILVPLEFLSVFIIRPFTLTIRLTANLIAGHLLLTVLFLGTDYLVHRQLTIGFGVATALIGAGFVGFEIFVAGLQAFIFTILTAVYISGSMKPAH